MNWRGRFPRLALSALALAGLCGAASAQTTWYVDITGTPPGSGTALDPYTSIQYAISRPGTLNGDKVLVLPGTYVENIDFLGKAITVVSQAGAAATTLDGGGGAAFLSTVTFQSGEGIDSVLDGFRVTNGWGTIDGAFTFTEGGGILIKGASPTLLSCRVDRNEADKGAGIFSEGGSPTISLCVVADNNLLFVPFNSWGGGGWLDGGAPVLDQVAFRNNYAGSGGGGLWLTGTMPKFTDCDVEDNRTTIDGGGAYLEGSKASFQGCSIEGNYSSDSRGGGLYVDGTSTATMRESDLTDNMVDNDHTGGGAYVDAGGTLAFFDGSITLNYSARGGGVASNGTLLIQDSRICDNTAQSFQSLDGRGGGLWIGAGVANVFGTCLDRNEAIPGAGAGGQGGAVYGPAYMENCTVVLNKAAAAGGVFNASMKNCVHWFNLPAAIPAPGAVTYSDVQGGLAGVGNIAGNPDLWDPPGGDYHLLASSPCIDTGDPLSPPDPDGSRADMGCHHHDPSYAAIYCTAGISASGCQALIGSSGVPSASAASGFDVTASTVEAMKNGLFYFGINGRKVPATPWGTSSSFQCVQPPVKRGPLLGSGGSTGCTGAFAFDLNAYWCPACPKPGHNPGAGAIVDGQWWYRDPLSTSGATTARSDAIEFQVFP